MSLEPSNKGAGPDAVCVAIVDDDPAVRDAIAFLLKSQGTTTRTFESAEAFLDSAAADKIDCIILDIRMPGRSGLELQRALTDHHWSAPIIFITGHADIEIAVQAMRNGAFHFLQKPFDDSELLTVVNDALGQVANNSGYHKTVGKLTERYASLSPREKQVMSRVTDGQANKVIAFDLSVSQRTVEIHRARVMKKMGVRNLAELVRAQIALTGESPIEAP
ncbi:MAG: response regulator [Pseudomonadota bacterium]